MWPETGRCLPFLPYNQLATAIWVPFRAERHSQRYVGLMQHQVRLSTNGVFRFGGT